MIKTKEKFIVSVDITLPALFEVEAENLDQAELLAQVNLDEMNIQAAFLNFLLHNGTIVTPKIHDTNIQIIDVEEK